MSYQLKVLRDYPIAFWPLDETSGSIAYDVSGCGNHGQYNGTLINNLVPLISGGNQATQIDENTSLEFYVKNNYYGREQQYPLATRYSSDNDFSIEFWFFPINNYYSENSYPMKLVEGKNSFLIYLDKGTLVFEVYGNNGNTYKTSKYLDFDNKSFHVVASYTVNGIVLYVEGLQSDITVLPSGFKFDSSDPYLTLKVPAVEAGSGDKFLIDAIAVYRYAISYDTVLTHLTDGNVQIEPIQVAFPDGGIINQINDTKLFKTLTYTYPQNKDFYSFINSTTSQKIEYDEKNQSLKFLDTLTGSQSVLLEDIVYIPSSVGTSSKIEWRGNFGITVETSVDGITYQSCKNGEVIPQYKFGSFNSSGNIYIRITMSTEDASESKPVFSFFAISIYNNKEIPSENGAEFITKDANSEYSVGTLNYPILSRHINNGIKPYKFLETVSNNILVTFKDGSNSVSYSTDEGLTWTTTTCPGSSNSFFRSVSFGNNRFVAVDNNSNKSIYSLDGINWTENTLPFNNQNGLISNFGNNKFVVLKAFTSQTAYSSNGVTWTSGTISSNIQWRSLAYGTDKFVAVGGAGGVGGITNSGAYSLDGISWTNFTFPISAYWNKVFYGLDKFVALDGNGETNNAAYSTDGINWTAITLPVSDYWQDGAYGNGKFVVVGSNKIIYSSDGISWTEASYTPDPGFGGPSAQAIEFFNGKFVITSFFARTIISTDGINWQTYNNLPDYAGRVGLAGGTITNSLFLKGSFRLSTDKQIKAIEFFYTPDSLGNKNFVNYNLLFSPLNGDSPLTRYYWTPGESPEITKVNIDSIYVNGQNATSESYPLYLFKEKNLHHVIINFTTPITGDIYFNMIPNSLIPNPSFGLNDSFTALFQNITIYENEISGWKAGDHYSLYTSKATSSILDSAIKVTENEPKYYNNDWVVISRI